LAADDAGLIPRERCLHRDVGAEEMALVSGTLEQLAHRVARDAVRPSSANDDARVHRLNLPAFVDQFDKEAVGVRWHLRRRDPPLDCAAERD
jgi:hypothetical protein